MLKKLLLRAAITAVALSCTQVFASDQAQPAKASHFVRVGTTLYVSGHFSKWIGQFGTYGWNLGADDPKLDTVVFVDTLSERQERPGAGEGFKKRAVPRGWNVVVVGRCDLFCARMVIGGRSRTLAPGAFFDLQVPRDYATKKLELRFPHTQFAIYESNELANAHRDVYYEAFTRGGDTGGLRVDATSARFCSERGPDKDCKDYPLNALSLGLTTSVEPALVDIPLNLIR